MRRLRVAYYKFRAKRLTAMERAQAWEIVGGHWGKR